MAAQEITLAGKRFVIIPAKEYRALCGKNGRVVESARARRRTVKRRLTAQDRGDIAEALRRLNDPSDKVISYAQVRKRLGLA